MKTILIAGGAGFIGSNFIYMLLEKRKTYRIICVDALTYAANVNTLDRAKTYSNFVFYNEDIRKRKNIFDIFEKERPEVVVNFAAESHVDKSIEDSRVFLETNVYGVQVLLEACRKYDIKRFHQVSTDEVYGELPTDRKDLMFNEESHLQPSNPYSASKAAADLLVLSYYKTYDLAVSISRCSNNYGPYQFPEKLIPLMIYNAINDKELPLYGDGLNVRDWIFVKDHCDAILDIIEKGNAGEIYNIGAHNEKTNIEIVKTILNELGKTEEHIVYVADRKGHDRRYAIDFTKISKTLQWKPKTMFSDGIEQTIQWYKDNTDWLKACTKNDY